MANTITARTLVGSGSDPVIVRQIHIVSDGTEETDYVVYDNSAFVADVSKGKLLHVMVMGDSGILRLEWDQTADSAALSVDAANGMHFDFGPFGGIKNPNGTGATGDLVLSTADLDAGDEVTLIVYIGQD